MTEPKLHCDYAPTGERSNKLPLRFLSVQEFLADGFVLVSAPINWQIDYVVVHPNARGRGVAGGLVRATLNEAFRRNVPYVMLTSREGLRPLYEACGFTGVNAPAPAA